ncbi:MAG: ABC transporter substrate-binding protein [Nocardioidaceae bacterium]
MQRSGPTRRGLLRAGGVGLVAASAVGCDMLSTNPDGQKKDAGGSGSATNKNPKQAPTLDAKVKSGELPQVADRLPDKPLVIKPTDSIGKYGGTWHSWFQGLGATYIFDDEVGYDYLVRWDPKWEKVIPNLAESCDVGKDGRTYTFHLRKGTRWSDGKPLTADDLVFAYEDVLKNSWLS